MSYLSVRISDPIRDLVVDAHMQGHWIHVSHLSAACDTDAEFSYALILAENWGVEIKGINRTVSGSYCIPAFRQLDYARNRYQQGSIGAGMAVIMGLFAIAVLLGLGTLWGPIMVLWAQISTALGSLL